MELGQTVMTRTVGNAVVWKDIRIMIGEICRLKINA